MIRFIIFLFLFICLTPSHLYAHELKKEETIGAVLHISPDDDPIIGEPSNFFFEFKDITDAFTPQNCDCRVIIYQNDKKIYQQPLFQNIQNPSLTDASFTYTFPEKNLYTISVKGKPIKENSFKEFSLTYTINVSREPKVESQTKNIVKENTMYILGIFLILGFGILLYRRKRNSQDTH